MTAKKLEDLYTSSHFDQNEILAALKKNGAAVLPQFASEDNLGTLRAEFDRVFEDKSEFIFHIDYEAGRACSLSNTDKFREVYPSISSFFSSKQMTDLVESYIGVPNLPNHEIYATHEYKAGKSVAPTHFDKLWTLKFMLYLEDTNEGAAPFGVVPGSAKLARSEFRRIFSDNGISNLEMIDLKYQKMNNSNPELDKEVIDIIGPAGTLIIFDTDTYHHASPVHQNCQRKILRGHSASYAQYKRVAKYSRQWWRGEKAYSKFDFLKDKLLNRVS